MDKLDFLFIHVETSLAPIMGHSYLAPLGTVSIATYLREQGFKARVVDTRRTFFTLKWLENYLSERKPKFVGFTMYTDTIFNVNRIIKLVKKLSPASKIVCGGAHAAVSDEDLLRNYDVDVVVRTIGETASLELLQNKQYGDINGISYLDSKRLVRNPDSPKIELDQYPSPDTSVVECVDRYPYGPSIITGRGCPYRCTFCAAGVISPKVHWRSIERNMEDIDVARKDCFSGILSVLDDTFTVDMNRITEFCDRIKEKGGGEEFIWFAEGRVDTISKNPGLLKKMYDSGFRLLQLGVESGDRKVLNAYRKNIDLDDVLSTVKECAELGIFMHTNFIVGGPFESDETIENTRNFAYKLLEAGGGYLQIGFPYLSPFPGTDIYDDPDAYGLKMLDPKLYRTAIFDNCVTETEALSREEIIWHRCNLMDEVRNAMFETIKSQNDEFIKNCHEAKRIAGEFHMSLVAEYYDDWTSYQMSLWSLLFDSIENIPQLKKTGGNDIKTLIPTRTASVVINEDGRVDFPYIKESISPLESQIYDFSAGKLTSYEIAKEIDVDYKKVEEAVRSLENIQAICYRTY
ncbi:MAG: radical SAM protein [Deltaproteobacteria bacterium]|nr:radical SAM protein [Deltaproteobacteria bacterium]